MALPGLALPPLAELLRSWAAHSQLFIFTCCDPIRCWQYYAPLVFASPLMTWYSPEGNQVGCCLQMVTRACTCCSCARMASSMLASACALACSDGAAACPLQGTLGHAIMRWFGLPCSSPWGRHTST